MKATPPQGTPEGSTEAPRDASAARAASPSYRRWLPLVLVAIAATALAYGVGRVQGALALRQAEQRNADDRAAFQASLAACEADRSLLQARRSLSLVAVSLDRRNFGVAESHRQRALEAFAGPALNGVTAVTELATQIRGLDLAVDPDPGTKREQVIAVSEALDRLVTERGGSVPAPATATKGQ